MDWESVSDADLARQCRTGSSEAWRQLIRRCSPSAYRVAMQMLRNPAEADDACQETFLKMYRAFDTFDPTRPLTPWVAKITYNVCLRRREGVIQSATFAVEPGALNGFANGHRNSPEEETAQRQSSAQLNRAMEVLGDQDRALITMHYREGLSMAEVADAADMPVNSVKTRLSRARARLKKALRPILRGEVRGDVRGDES